MEDQNQSKEKQENDAVVQSDYVNTPLIQVNASILRKDIEYETVPIDMSTTAQDVVSLLVNKYGTSNSMEEDYYLAECVENGPDSYKRNIPKREKVLLVRQKWRKNGNGHFLLCKIELDTDNYVKNHYYIATIVSPTGSYKEGFLSPPHVVNNQNTRKLKRRHSLPILESQLPWSNEKSSLVLVDDCPLYRARPPAPWNMSGMMNQVVNESHSLPPHNNYSKPQDLPTSKTPLPKMQREVVSIEPLVCSPSYSAVRVYPEFIFSSELTTFDGQEAFTPSSLDNLESEERKQEKEKKITVETAVFKEHNYHLVKPKRMFVKSDNTYINSGATTTAMSSIIPTNPRSITPEYNDHDDSEMNLLDTLSTIYNAKLSLYGVMGGSHDDDDDDPLQLISPRRKSSLVSEVCDHIQKKRSSSLITPLDSASSNHRPLASKGSKKRRPSSSNALLSPAHRQQLIDSASEFIYETRQRKSQGNLEGINQPPVLGLHVKEEEDTGENTELMFADEPQFKNIVNISATDSAQSSQDSNSTTQEDDDPHTAMEINDVSQKKFTKKLHSSLRRYKSERSRPHLFSIFTRKGGGSTPKAEKKEDFVKRSHSAHFQRDRLQS